MAGLSRPSYSIFNNLEKTNQCIFIKGNHDAWAEEWLATGFADPEWVKHGGAETIESYEGFSKEEIESHTRFFNKMPLYVIDGEKRLFVHAGFSSMHGPKMNVLKPISTGTGLCGSWHSQLTFN